MTLINYSIHIQLHNAFIWIAVHFGDLLSKFGIFGAAVESLYMRSFSN
jgi:hypothetical protein